MIRKIVDSYRRWQRSRKIRGSRGPDFAPGDHAINIGSGTWTAYETGLPDIGPAHGQVCVVTAIGMLHDCQLIWLKGWPVWFTACSFRKLVQDKTEAHNECPDLLKLIKHKEDA